jgi:hypothetical protein
MKSQNVWNMSLFEHLFKGFSHYLAFIYFLLFSKPNIDRFQQAVYAASIKSELKNSCIWSGGDGEKVICSTNFLYVKKTTKAAEKTSGNLATNWFRN